MREDLSLNLSFRTTAIESLHAIVDGSGRAESVILAAEAAESLVGGNIAGDPVWAYGILLRALASAMRWEPALRCAEINPSRFRDAAQHLAQSALEAKAETQWPTRLVEAATRMAQLTEPSQVAECAAQLLAVPLPVRLTSIARPRMPRKFDCESPETLAPELPVLVLLAIDDQAIQVPMTVHPNRIYRLGVALRTQAWPEAAEALHLDFVSVLRPNILELQALRFEKTTNLLETVLQIRGDLDPSGKGHDVTLRAGYLTTDGGRIPVRIVGHPKLRLKTFDPSTALPLALPMVASRLQDMISLLDSKLPEFPSEDRKDLFVLLESLLRFATRAMQQKVLDGEERYVEAQFQQELSGHFHADPGIGHRLSEAPRQSGGITDLSIGRIVLELKVERDSPVSLADAHRFMSQPAHYASGRDCPVSVLCILDDSHKSTPPGIPADYLDWIYPRLHGLDDPRYPAMVAAVIVPIRFPTSSTWSR